MRWLWNVGRADLRGWDAFGLHLIGGLAGAMDKVQFVHVQSTGHRALRRQLCFRKAMFAHCTDTEQPANIIRACHTLPLPGQSASAVLGLWHALPSAISTEVLEVI